MRQRNPSGNTLTLTLAVVALIAALAAVLTQSMLTHVHFSSTFSVSERARHAAESALAQAIDKIMVDRSRGRSRDKADDVHLTFTTPDMPEATGVVSYTLDSVQRLDVPFSTNNLNSSRSAPGYQDRQVAAESVHLVARGACGSSTYLAESIIVLPSFEQAIASTGPVEVQGKLLLATVSDPSMLDDPNLDQSELLPGHLVTNSAETISADLSNETRITGDVRTRGGVTRQPGTFIGGSIERIGEPAVLPEFDIESMDPIGQDGLIKLEGSLPTSTIDGPSRREGDLVVQGDLRLRNGLVFVTGNVRIHGALEGTGALISLGQVEIDKGAHLKSDSQAVLMARGDVTLRGANADSSYYQGMVYTEGDVRAERVALVGVLIGNSQKPGGSRMTLEDVRLYQYEPYAQGDPYERKPRSSSTLRVGDALPESLTGLLDSDLVDILNTPITVSYNGKRHTYEAPPLLAGATSNRQKLMRAFEESLEKAKLPGPDAVEFMKYVDALLDEMEQKTANGEGYRSEPPPSGSPAADGGFNYSRFLRLDERMQIRLWGRFTEATTSAGKP